LGRLNQRWAMAHRAPAAQAPDPGEDHQHAQADHHPERPEHDARVGSIFRREFLQRRDLLIQAVGQDQAAEGGNLQLEAGFLAPMSGQPNRISGVGSSPTFSQWPSIAAIFAG